MDIFDMAKEYANKTFINLNENFSVRVSSITAVMIQPEDSTKVKVEYGPQNSIFIMVFGTESEAKEYFQRLRQLLTV